ncbi:MAG: hypothetical protein ACOH2N_12315 [Devosia sp.]
MSDKSTPTLNVNELFKHFLQDQKQRHAVQDSLSGHMIRGIDEVGAGLLVDALDEGVTSDPSSLFNFAVEELAFLQLGLEQLIVEFARYKASHSIHFRVPQVAEGKAA